MEQPITPKTQASQPQRDFPLPLTAFLKQLKGSEDEIWSKLLKLAHGQEKRTLKLWNAALESLKAS